MSDLPEDRRGLEALLRQSFPTLADALTSEDALPFVPARIALRALPALERACEPATNDELTFALGWLASVTASDKQRSPETMQISARALALAMRDYPRAAALEAIREWPKSENGKWWPTESELRQAAEKLSWQTTRLHTHLKAAAASEAARAPRSDTPGHELEHFFDEAIKLHGEGFYKSWLSPLTCQYQGNTIWTHPLGVERLYDRCGKIMERLNITAAWDKESRNHFRKRTEHYEPQKKKGWK